MRFHRAALPSLTLLTALAALLPRQAFAQSEADLSWYEGGKPADDAPSERRYESGTSADSAEAGEVGHMTDNSGFGFGLSGAYALPLGDFADNAAMTRFVRGAIRPAFDVHYFLNESFGLGVYTGLGVGFQSSDFKKQCDVGNTRCSLLLVDAGLFGEYRVLPRGPIVPYVQLNVGYEHYRNKITSSQSALGVTVKGEGKFRARGVGFGATVGADMRLKNFGVGPFFSAQFGSYRSSDFAASAGSLGTSGGGNDFNKALHYFLLFGVRGRFELR